MNKLSLVLVLIIAGVFSTAPVLAWQSGNAPEHPEFARDTAIDYVLLNHEELRGLQTPSSWETRNLTPTGWCGSSTLQYIGDGWTVKVTYPVIPDPTYTVEIECKNGISFHWQGTVDQDGNVDEMHFTAVQ